MKSFLSPLKVFTVITVSGFAICKNYIIQQQKKQSADKRNNVIEGLNAVFAEFASIKNSETPESDAAQAQPHSSPKRLNFIVTKTSPSVEMAEGEVYHLLLKVFGVCGIIIKKWILITGENKMNKKEIILSFIVPVYNVEEYLEECLDSLVTQDIPYDEYEIICVDDGSTDKSGEILDVYAQKHENIIVIHKENGGVSSARNCGIDTANGQYIWFVDADDFIKTNCLSAIKTKITENKYDTIRILPYSFAHSQNNLTLNNITPDMCQKNIKNFMITHIFKKQYVTINKIYFDTKISYAEDAVFMLQLNLFLRTTTKIEESVLYFYRQRPGSAMSQNIDKKINSRLNAALVCEEIIQGKRIGSVEKAIEFKYNFIVKTMEMLVKLPKAERKRIKRDLEKNKLFPLKYNSKYTPKSRKAKTSFVKKVRNSLIDISYTRFGYFLLSAFFATKGVLGKLK